MDRFEKFDDLRKMWIDAYVRINENQPGNKVSQYFQKTSDGKQILRDVMRRYIPDEIANAEKQGFSSPDASWFKGESIDFVKRRLCNPAAAIYQFLDFKAVQPLLTEHFEGRLNQRLLIWSLISVDCALIKFFNAA